MSFEFNDEKAIDVLIWWVEASDGSIDYTEEQAVKEVLQDMNYSMKTFYQDTLQHIGALATEDLRKLVDQALEWGQTHFDHHKKQITLALLAVIAESNGEITGDQQQKLDTVKEKFGLQDLKGYKG